jgi:CRISPR/Cas system-associated exonuclease Cas4 (RecB family)
MSFQLTLLREPVTDWPEMIDHISPSQISTFFECKREFQERYVHKRKKRPAEAPVVGSAIHRALEQNFRQKIETHVDLPVVDLIQWYDDLGWDLIVDDEQERSGSEIEWDTSPDEAKTRGRKILGGYRNEVCERLQPIDVEGSFSIPIEGVPVPMIGRFDLLTDPVAIDWKSGKQRQTKPKSAWHLQAMTYGFATGKPVEFHTMSCTLRDGKVSIVTPLESPELFVNPSQREIDEWQFLVRDYVREVAFYMRTYGPDTPWPTNGRFHIFACDYCSFRDDCPAWEHER